MILDSAKAKRLWIIFRPYWKYELATLLVMVVLISLGLALPMAVRYLIDDLIPKVTTAANPGAVVAPLAAFAAVLVGIYVAQTLLSWARDYMVGYFGANIMADLRSALFGHLEALSFRFHHRHQIGEIMSRELSDVARMQDLLTQVLVILAQVLMIVAYSIYLFSLNWKLTLIAVVPIPLTILVTNRFTSRLHGLSKGIQENTARLSARLQEALAGIKVIKAFGREGHERKRVEAVHAGLTGLLIRFSVSRSLAVNTVNLINMIGPIIVLSGGVYLIADKTMTLGALMAFFMLVTSLYSPIQGLAAAKVEIPAAMASVNRIFEYLDIPPEVTEDPEPVTLARARGEIELRNVGFTYDESDFRFKHLDLHIRAGETIALVGPSGSGKTTLINLVMRFYDPDEGTIALDGVNLRRLSLKSLRDSIALVDQDPLLFNATIGENIAYSLPDATPDQIMAAARIANIHDFISKLPDGYNSMVGERGVTLSGGEKQRICLARAILKDPPVLILDEATSALDSISEQLIQEALAKILTNKTAIIIAHRLSTVQRADRILTMQNGEIIDQGSHEDLLQKSPLYRELAQKQLRS